MNRSIAGVSIALLSIVPVIALADVGVDITWPSDGHVTTAGEQVCVEFDFELPPGYVVSFAKLYANSLERSASCTFDPGVSQGSGACCYTAAPSDCASVLNVRVHRCPDTNIYSPPVQIFAYDPATNQSCVNSPQCERERPGCYRGGPVDVVTGGMYHEAVDFVLPGPLPVRFARRYDSQERGRTGAFGPGFRHSFEESLECDGYTCTYTSADGNTYRCGRDALPVNGWVCAAPIELTELNENNPPYHKMVVEGPDNTRRSFSTVTFGGSTGLRLKRVRDRNENDVILSYGPGNFVFVNTEAAQITIEYINGRIASLKRSDGKKILYSYDAGRLAHVIYPYDPVQTVGGDIELNYWYEAGPSEPNLLTRVTDKHGHVLEGWEYNHPDRRATRFFREDLGEGTVEDLAFSYSSAEQTTVTDPYGVTTTYLTSPEYRMVRSVSGPHPTGPIPGATSLSVVPTASGPWRIGDFADGESNVTHFEYEPASSPTVKDKLWNVTRIDELGNEPRTTEICYDSTFNVPIRIVRKSVGTCIVPDGPWTFCEAEPGDDETTLTRILDVEGNVIEEHLRGCAGGEETLSYVRRFEYRWTGQLTKSWSPRPEVTRPVEFDYNGNFWLKKVTVPVGLDPVATPDLVIRLEDYDLLGNPRRIVRADGSVVELEYDLMGRIITQTVKAQQAGEEDIVTRYGYDDHVGRLARIEMPEGGTWTFTLDAAHRLTDVVDPLGNRAVSTYDRMDRLFKQEMKTDTGAVTYSRDYDYDDYGRLEKVDFATTPWPHPPLPSIQSIIFGYDGNGNLNTVTDAEEHFTSLRYDNLRRVWDIVRYRTFGGGSIDPTSFAYDLNDQPTQIVAPNGESTYRTTSDAATTLASDSRDQGLSSYEYDEAGNLTRSVDGRLVEAVYSYDWMDRPTDVTYPAHPEDDVHFAYDASSVSYGEGRLTGVVDATGTMTYHYDRLGNVVREERSGTAPGTTVYGHDKNGNVTTIDYPFSQRQVVYAYDAADRVTSVDAGVQGSLLRIADEFAYYPFGPASSYRLLTTPSTTVSKLFDQSYAQIRATYSSSAGSILDYEYGYDPHGFVNHIEDKVQLSGTRSFIYDSLHRLTTAETPLGFDVTYGFQSHPTLDNGNRWTKDVGDVHTEYIYDGVHRNRLTDLAITFDEPPYEDDRHYEYDGAGNVDDVDCFMCGFATTYSYNAAGQISEFGEGAPPEVPGSLSYDALRRLTKVTEQVLSPAQEPSFDLFRYTSVGSLLEEETHLGLEEQVGATDRKSYVWLHGMPFARVDTAGATDELYYYHTDHLGTPIAMTDGSASLVWRAEYLPFGEVFDLPVAQVSNRLRLPGQFLEDRATNLYYNWHRFYDPSLGRYLQPDPFLDPMVSAYAYALNNPLTYTDPAGLAVLVNDMSTGTVSFVPYPECPGCAVVFVPGSNAVVRGSQPGAQNGFVTPDVNVVPNAHPGRAYGPPGSYINTDDPRGRDVHGGGSSLRFPLVPDQPLTPTFGCTRLHNADVATLGRVITAFKKKYGVTVPYIRYGTPPSATHQNRTVSPAFGDAVESGQLQLYSPPLVPPESPLGRALRSGAVQLLYTDD